MRIRPPRRKGRNLPTSQPRGPVMRFANYLNRLRQYLRRGSPRQRPEKFQSRPRVEELEGRMLLSTLNLDALVHANATYTASTGVANNLTVSEIFQPFVRNRIFTDTAEKITV